MEPSDPTIVRDLELREEHRRDKSYVLADVIRDDCQKRGWEIEDLSEAKGKYGWDATGYTNYWRGTTLCEFALVVNKDGTGSLGRRERVLQRA